MRALLKLVLFLGCFALLTSAAIAANQAEDIVSQESWVLAGDRSFVPYEFYENGELKGANVDLLREIEKTTGKKIKIELNQWADSQNKAKNGEVNGLTMLTINPERSKIYDFSRPTFFMKFSLFVQSQNIDLITIDKIAGKKIAIKRGGYPHQVVAKEHPEMIPVLVDNVLEGFQLLRVGQVDGVLEENWVGYYTLLENNFTGIRATGQPIATLPCYISLRKGNPEAIALINSAIEKINADGRYDRILNKWSGQEVILFKREAVKRYTLIAGIIFLSLLISVALATIARIRIKRKAKILESLATVDNLTKIGNRKFFNRVLNAEWKRMEREKKNLGLILFVVDSFGMLKESHGRKAGEVCLKQVAETVRANTFRPGDTIARYSPEEFAVILPDTDAKGTMKVAETLRKAISQLEIVHDGSPKPYTITTSVGAATLEPANNKQSGELVQLAEEALVKAIESGQNRVYAA